ncbi:MAG: cell division protein FtsQ [Subtercola sp.]|nr:cell division protein FtsQ [Subtercola sp.]
MTRVKAVAPAATVPPANALPATVPPATVPPAAAPATTAAPRKDATGSKGDLNEHSASLSSPGGGAGTRSARSALRAAARRRRVEQQEARRFTERSRRRRLTWIVSLGAIAALVLVVLFTAYSPVFAVRAITVQGTSRIDAGQVQAALADQVGKPLALVDFGRMESELAGFPLIQSYSTESSLPNTLIVRIVERQPVAQITAAAGGFDLVDPAGVVVSHSDARQDGFPVIDTAASAVGSPGFLGATAVLRAMPADLLAKVDTITAATPDSVSFTLSGADQKVVWGSDANSALKAKVLDKLIGTQNADDSLTYDVSSPESPVVSG